MINVVEKQNCCGCHACFNICPVNCITMVEDEEGFLYPRADSNKCINCCLCEKVCLEVNDKEKVSNVEAYACMNNDEEVRLKSSSGGMFILLAENVINNGGIVFGAGFDDELNLVHSYTDDINGLSKYMGSKYLQSKIGSTYKQAKEFLEKGIKVLFSGTPCQISGLLHYLGKDYKNLICVDIICHGVPSPKVFKLYKTEIEKKYSSIIKTIDFRNKAYGWKLFSISLLFNNGTRYNKNLIEDMYMKGFLKDLYLRPSCYYCKSKTLNRLSDITIADFWGIENIVPEMNDGKGTSLVLINSDEGKALFNKLRNSIILKKVEYSEAIKYNSAAIKSAPFNKNRGKFFKEVNSHNYKIIKLISKYTKTSFIDIIRFKMTNVGCKIRKKVDKRHI